MMRIILVTGMLVVLAELACGQSVPMGINYQGVLKNANNEVLSTGDYALTFRIFAGEEGGNPLWEQVFGSGSLARVPVVDGAFNVVLGPRQGAAQSEIDQWLAAFNQAPRYLEIQVGPDGPLLPRQQILAAPFALNSATLGGKGSGAFVNKNGDTMTDTLSVSTANRTGSAIVGYASDDSDERNAGGSFKAEGWEGVGVEGMATSTSGRTNYGGMFEAQGQHGVGVKGLATNVSMNTTYGGLFEALGPIGQGVRGVASYAGPESTLNYGGSFENNGLRGAGVKGFALNASPDAQSYGGYFHSAAGHGIGVLGTSDNTIGVQGQAPAYGGWFSAPGAGNNCSGVYGEAGSTAAITNFGGHFKAGGTTGRGVTAYAVSEADAENIGGYFEAHGKQGVGVKGWAGNGNIGVWGYGKSRDFYAAGPGVNYAAFTGAHEVKLDVSFPEKVIPGYLVVTTGQTAKREESGQVSVSSTLPTVKLCDLASDPNVFGVLVDESALPQDHWFSKSEGDRFGLVNAVGEGRAWVSNMAGEIQSGDYITTSEIPGYGQKQADDVLHSYTLGKATETLDWNAVTETVEHNGKKYKVYLIALVYTSG